MKYGQDALRNELKNWFDAAKKRNIRTSLRSCATRIGMSASALSEILSGRRSVSRKFAERILKSLEVSPSRTSAILDLFADRRSQIPRGLTPQVRQEMDDEYFRSIAEWYHGAILMLVRTKGFQSDPMWIAGRLGITPDQAQSALDRLVELKMLYRADDGSVSASDRNYKSRDGVPSPVIRAYHRQQLELASKVLEQVPVDERDFSSVVLAIDPERIPEFKAMLRDFRDRVSTFLESGEKKEVYTLAVQLFPLSRKGKE